MTTFAQRLTVAQDFENTVADALQRLGWDVTTYGQGLLTPEARRILRGDPHAQHRWLPDLLAHRDGVRVLVEAKASFSETANHSIEKASLSALVEHERVGGMPLYIVFSDWRVIRACELWSATDDHSICRSGPMNVNGSGTPYWLIVKAKLPLTFDDVFGCNGRKV